MKKKTKNIKVRDLKPKKDAKGGMYYAGPVQGPVKGPVKGPVQGPGK
jgi:hypothetical protein